MALRTWMCAFGALSLMTAVTAQAQTTVLLRDGVPAGAPYAGTRDVAFINPYSFTDPDANYGTAATMSGDGYPEQLRPLMRFDVSAIPPGTPLVSVQLILSVSFTSNDNYELAALNADWVENEVTWNQRSVGLAWTVPGANADTVGTGLAVFRPSATGPVTMTFTAAGLAAVQRWVDNPVTNRGFLIRPQSSPGSDGVRLRSSDDTTITNRPMLIVATQGGSTFQFQDGMFPTAAYSGTADSFIGFGPPFANLNGQGLQIWGPPTGERAMSLLRFELSGAIPQGAQITEASLMLTGSLAHPGGGEIFALSRAWDETKATWLTSDGVQQWSTPGADSTVDHGATPVAILPAAANQAFTVGLGDAGVTLLQSWVDGQPNYGFFLVSAVGAERFFVSDREDAIVDHRPGLVITFISDGGPPDGGPSDAGSSDGGSSDAGSSDAGPSDAGSSDAGPSDAGPPDGGVEVRPLVLTVGCGCGALADGASLVPLLLWVFARRRVR